MERAQRAAGIAAPPSEGNDVTTEAQAEAARAAVETINAEMRRRWARAEQLQESDDAEDRFLAEYHRSEVRDAVTRQAPAA